MKKLFILISTLVSLSAFAGKSDPIRGYVETSLRQPNQLSEAQAQGVANAINSLFREEERPFRESFDHLHRQQEAMDREIGEINKRIASHQERSNQLRAQMAQTERQRQRPDFNVSIQEMIQNSIRQEMEREVAEREKRDLENQRREKEHRRWELAEQERKAREEAYQLEQYYKWENEEREKQRRAEEERLHEEARRKEEEDYKLREYYKWENAEKERKADEITSQFKSPEGEFRNELRQLYRDLYLTNPQGEARSLSKSLGFIATETADQAFSQGEKAEAHFYKDLGKGFFDIVVGLDPITGIGRSGYEFLTGKNLITGEHLGAFERSLAFVGLATFGGNNYLKVAGKGMSRIYQGSLHIIESRSVQVAIHEGEVLIEKAGSTLVQWSKKHRITTIETAEVANERFRSLLTDMTYQFQPPWKYGTHVVQFTTTHESRFVRVSSYHKSEGGEWMVKINEIRGMTPEQIQRHLNLPTLPTHIQEVHIPAGIKMSRGMTNGNKWENLVGEVLEGQVQYHLEVKYSSEWFKELKEIGERVF